jgi:hypothetical protein
MLYSLIGLMGYDINHTLLVYANQTVQLPEVKITSHVQDQLVPTGTLSIMGVSTDNSSSGCDVYIILNEIRPYQRVYPTGSNMTENNDYSTWNYTFKSEYATIQEGNNRMVSKIACFGSNENLTKFNSLNVTGMELARDVVDSDLTMPSTNSTAHSSSQTNTTQDSIPEQEYGSDLGDSHLNRSQDAATLDDEQMEEEDDNSVKNDDIDYRSSRDEDEENERNFRIEEWHERVLDQVTEQLRESGINFPP